MTSEVGSGQVAIFPTFKGFRKAVAGEVDGTTSNAASRFTTGFTKAGTSSGKAFGGALSAAASPGLKAAQSQLASAAAAVSSARLREQNAAGQVRVAEAALASARSKFAGDSVQVVRAEERLASSERTLQSQQESLAASSRRLTAARLSVSSSADTAVASGLRLNNVFGTLPSIFKVNGSQSGQKFLTGFTDVLGGVIGANVLTGVGFAVGRGINDIISGGIRTALSSVSLASDLNETTSAVTQVFGPSAAQGIVAFSKTADKSLAQTQQQALLGAQTFGVFGKAAGLQGPKLVGFSTGLVQLAGDLASFYNTTPQDAITAITAGLRGESEPLRQYGVLLDDASLRQEALRLGITKTTKTALTPQQRVLAAQSLILKQTTIAQGDFTRTSSGLANSQRILSAEIANTQAQLGTFLLPAFTSFVHYAGTDILPAAQSLISKYGPELGAALQSAKPGVKALFQDLDPLVGKVADLVGTQGIPALVKSADDFAKAAPAWIDAFKSIDKAGNDFLKGSGIVGGGGVAGDLHNSFVHGADQIGSFFDGIRADLDANLHGGKYDFTKDFSATGSDWGKDLADGISAGWDDKFITTFQGVKGSATDSLKDFDFDTFSAGHSAGDAFGQGLVEGMRAKSGPVAKAGSDLGTAAIQGARFALRVSSPSKAAREIGQYFGDGQALGMLDRVGDVISASRALAGAALGSHPLGSASSGSSKSQGTGGVVVNQKIYTIDPMLAGAQSAQQIKSALVLLR